MVKEHLFEIVAVMAVMVGFLFICSFFTLALTSNPKTEYTCSERYMYVFAGCVTRITNMQKNGDTSVCAVAAQQAADYCKEEGK